jgi:hypothetical protein
MAGVGMGRWNLAGGSGLLATALAFALALAPALALAGQVVINGVPIGRVDITVQGLEGITFEKCASVKIEASGEIRIDCPGYDLQSAIPLTASTGVPVQPARITKRYWLVTEQREKGATQFDVDLYVNSKWIKRFKNDDDQVVLEITKHLVPGKNRVLFAATKNLSVPRRSESPQNFYRIVIGEGEISGGNVMIDTPLIDLRRTAAELENVTEEREILAR